MPESVTSVVATTIDGQTFSSTVTASGDGVRRASPSVAAAKAGTLTTRTNATDGTLTMSGGHGFQTGDTIDLFWSAGSRRGVTVGTVAVNSVPISGGAGVADDDLPIATTAITAVIAHEEAFEVDGDALLGLAVNCPKRGYVVFAEADDSVVKEYRFDASSSFSWIDGSGVDNPFTGVTVAKVLLSHADSAAAQTMKAAAVFE
jgi:hypothetical protein